MAIATNVILTRRLTTRQREIAAEATGFAQERLANITTVRAFTAESRDEEAYRRLLEEGHEMAGKVSKAKGVFMGGLFFGTCHVTPERLLSDQFLDLLAHIPSAPSPSPFLVSKSSATLTAVLYFGGSLAGQGDMTVGGLSSFVLYTGMVGLGSSGLANYVSETWKAAVSADKVFAMVDSRDGEPSGIRPEGKGRGEVELKGVRFAYPSRRTVEVLKGVDMQVGAGKRVAICGGSGGGKSTVLALLLRLYEPTGGQIYLDGKDLREYEAAWVREQIGIVDQEPALFTGTIAENIRYGRPDATDAEVIKAAMDANAHEFVSLFPAGYDTHVGERGNAQLSGGQKARIALARALLKQPPILLLDEATNSLDRESERLVQEALETAMKGRTVIIVGHRLSTVEKADTILVLEHGQVVESGAYEQLRRRPNGAFARLHSLLNLA